MEEQIWVVTVDGNFSRLYVRDLRHFTQGVTNLESREVAIDKETNTCQYLVDDQVCTSCQLCTNSVAVADCTNLIPEAVTVCNSPIGFLMKLLELNSEPNFTLDQEVLESTATLGPTLVGTSTSTGMSSFEIEESTITPTAIGTSLSEGAEAIERGSSQASVTFTLAPGT